MSRKLTPISEREEISTSPTSLVPKEFSDLSQNVTQSPSKQLAQLDQSRSGQNIKEKLLPLKKDSVAKHGNKNNITLTEDCFGLYYDQRGIPFKIQRFTWRNSDKVQVQVITYGARVTSIKLPDKRGVVDDIVLGFSDMSGYLYYGDLLFGATIGRMTSVIKNASFELDGKTINVTSNLSGHHVNGGFNGLDKVIWNAYVSDMKAILSYTLPDKHEGFPGSVMIQITYELTPKNEFLIDMQAKTVKPTIINLSNLCYFNLGGHHGGPNELYKHSVLINSNCYTLMDDDNIFPTGEIMNVVHTKYDFSSPKFMKNYLDFEPNGGFDQNLCVNRATSQGNCLVARVVHVENGRILEIYSNQYGVRFETANMLGLGVVSPPTQSKALISMSISEEGGIFVLFNDLYEAMTSIKEFNEENFIEVHNLLKKIYKVTLLRKGSTYSSMSLKYINPDFCAFGFIDALEKSVSGVGYLIPPNIDEITDWSELKMVVNDMLRKYEDIANDLEFSKYFRSVVDLDSFTNVEQPVEAEKSTESSGSRKLSQVVENIQRSITNELNKSHQSIDGTSGEKSHQSLKDEKSQQSVKGEKSAQNDLKQSPEKVDGNDLVNITSSVPEQAKSNTLSNHSDISELLQSVTLEYTNVIPSFYKDGRIHGKNNAIYKRHGAMAFQTQNYPDSIHHDNFPSPILRPGQVYKHTIVYRFWIKNGGLKAWKTKRKC